MKEKREKCINFHTNKHSCNHESNHKHEHKCNCNSVNIHEHNNEVEVIEKKDVVLYIISIIIFAISFIPILKQFQIWICLGVLVLAGYNLILNGIKNLFKLNFEEETLMTIAIISAFILGEYPESCMVVLLFKLGEFLEEKAVEKSNKSIKNIVAIKSNTANIIEKDGKVKIVNVEEVQVGNTILIKPGEIVPVDSQIINGESTLDMSRLTGESVPVEVGNGQNILSGSINLNGSLTCKVKKDYKNSTTSQIIDLVNEATNNKGKTEEFITKFAKIYTPIVIIIAFIVAILPPIIFNQEFKTWIIRGLVFLVASCPCSIVISVPLAFFSCIGASSKKGLLIKGTKHIEALANTYCVAFDKTGTVTTGKMQIENIHVRNGFSEQEFLQYTYLVAKNSNHPISTAITQKVENSQLETNNIAENFEEIAGHGITAKINEKKVLFGNAKLLKHNNIKMEEEKNSNYLVINDIIAGNITFKEEIRFNLEKTINELKKINVKEIVMLTGDNAENANKIAKEIGISKVYAELLPQEKQEKVKELKQNGKVVFVGDGINDSPVLAEADFGISMGEGTEIANDVADGILISNNIECLPQIIKISQKTIRIIKFNIIFSLVLKAVVLTMGVQGLAPIWLAVVADTGVSLLTVLNSMRIARGK